MESVETEISEKLKQLSMLESEQMHWNSDEILDELESILHGKIGPAPTSQSELDSIYKEGEIRFQFNMPPGYKDKIKEEIKDSNFSFGGLHYKKSSGI